MKKTISPLLFAKSVIGGTIAALALSVISAMVDTAYAEESFDVGMLLCQTGQCAEWGIESRKGVELAAEELNSAGGVLGRKIRLHLQDTAEGETGAQAVSAFRHLLRTGAIRYFIGPSWTTGGLSVAPIAAKEQIIITSPSLGVPDFNETADNIFNTWPHDAYATAALAKYSIAKNWKKAAIFSSEQPWESNQGNAFAAEFTKLGGEIVAKIETITTAVDLKGEALKIKNSEPQVVFFSNLNQLGISARELSRLGYRGPQLAVLMDKTRIDDAQGALEGCVFARYPDPGAEFRDKFIKRYGASPGITADTAYDTMKLYAAAIEKAETFEPQKVKKVLLEIEFSGATGPVRFDEKGGVIKSPVFYTVSGGKMVPAPS